MRFVRTLIEGTLAILVVVGLSAAIQFTIFCLEEDRCFTWGVLGLAFLTAAILVIELTLRFAITTSPGANFERVIFGLCLQAMMLLFFVGLLDFNVHLGACCYAYLAYLPVVAVVLARRRRALTNGDWLFLSWGWLPIVVICVPLFIRVSKNRAYLRALFCEWLTF